jgi:ABC-type transport system involved in multi-copper enzyme maturation permease subunit
MAMGVYFECRYESYATATQIGAFWNDFARTCAGVGGFAPLAALFIAASGVGEEFASGAPVLLFTRPRKRGYFVWTSWGIGMLEILAIMIGTLLSGAAVGLYFTHTVASWRFLLAFAYVLPASAMVYSLSHFAGVLGKGARQGMSISVLVILIYVVALPALVLKFGVHIPDWWLGNRSSTPSIVALATGGWLAVSLLFPLAAQVVLEGREI